MRAKDMGLPLAILVTCDDGQWVRAGWDIRVSPKKQATSIGRAKLLADRHNSARNARATRIFKDVSIFALFQYVVLSIVLLKGNGHIFKTRLQHSTCVRTNR
jgi:hypothetical protein